MNEIIEWTKSNGLLNWNLQIYRMESNGMQFKREWNRNGNGIKWNGNENAGTE